MFYKKELTKILLGSSYPKSVIICIMSTIHTSYMYKTKNQILKCYKNYY